METLSHIVKLTPKIEARIKKNPLLNLDTFIIPSPYIKDSTLEKDYEHSYIWIEEREILGYLLVYSDAKQQNFHIYKLVASPFGRGRGIGQAFIHNLAENIPDKACIYLYLWEKQSDTLEFFRTRGFSLGDTIVYRNLVYYHIYTYKEEILKGNLAQKAKAIEEAEIGKTRHDARKIVRLLSHMIDSLSAENCDRIVEDVNRETTAMINMLNIFRDSRKIIHEVNLRDLLLERIVPYIQASPLRCALHLKLNAKSSVILGYHETIGRALINIVSNSMDAIEAKADKGVIKIGLTDDEENLTLSIRDNGIGINAELLEKDETGIPIFVGRTTKSAGNSPSGEGLGTQQIFATFGAENITVKSSPEGTCYKIIFSKSSSELDERHAVLSRRYNEFKDLWEDYSIKKTTPRNEIIAFIWQLRKMEIFLFDLIMLFSTFQNIRFIYRTILSFMMNKTTEENLNEYIFNLKSDHEILKEWLFDISIEIKKRIIHLSQKVYDLNSFKGALFKSYGQAVDNVIIFTMDPESGRFFASDRKLAEHLDFVPYLGKEKNDLLRGEFTGDLNNDLKPIYLGVWSIDSDEGLIKRLKMMRLASKKLLDMGLHKEKKLGFYQTTYVNHKRDINSDLTTTLESFSELDDNQLMRFTRETFEDDEFDFLVQTD